LHRDTSCFCAEILEGSSVVSQYMVDFIVKERRDGFFFAKTAKIITDAALLRQVESTVPRQHIQGFRNERQEI